MSQRRSSMRRWRCYGCSDKGSLQLLSQSHRIRCCVMMRVRQADLHFSYPLFLGIRLTHAAQDQLRLAAVLAGDLHVEPAEILANASSECLRHRFLRSKASRVMNRRASLGLTVGTFRGGENLRREAFAELR